MHRPFGRDSTAARPTGNFICLRTCWTLTHLPRWQRCCAPKDLLVAHASAPLAALLCLQQWGHLEAEGNEDNCLSTKTFSLGNIAWEAIKHRQNTFGTDWVNKKKPENCQCRAVVARIYASSYANPRCNMPTSPRKACKYHSQNCCI